MMVRIGFTILLSLALVSGSSAENPVTEEWVARYNTFVSGIDIASAMAVDTAGSIYVTGTSWIDGYNCDMVTVKYDAAGNLLWTTRYDGPYHTNDGANAIAVDSQNNVYVAGSSSGVYTGPDLTTIKYDPAGNQLWVARYSGPGNEIDSAQAVAVDVAGNVHVTGYSRGDGMVTIKYDGGGRELWVAKYHEPNGGEQATALALDAAGNVYVTGAVTIKYDSEGNQLWVARGGNVLTLDTSGNIFAAGSDETDIVLYKYDTSGNLLWTARHDGPASMGDSVDAITTDAFGNVYLAGSVGTIPGSDLVTLKFDSAGNKLWVAQTGGGLGWPDSVAVDGSGNVYVVGFIGGGGVNSAITTLKYDAQGNPLWVAHYPGYGVASGLALDAGGNIIVCGWVRVKSQPVDGYEDDDIVIIKFDPDGSRLWLATHAEPARSYDEPVALVADASGNVYVAGSGMADEDLGPKSDIVVIKYDAGGTAAWVARYDEPAGSYEEAAAFAVDAAGNVYVTGFSRGEGSITQGLNYDIITIKYDSRGNRLWATRYDGPADDDYASAVKVDAAGDVYVAGRSDGGGSGLDMVTIKYDTAGSRIWVSRYNGPANGGDSAAALALDPSGNVYVTGTSHGGGSDSDIVTVKYDSSGNQLWAARYDGPTNMRDGARAVALDPFGNVYVLGYSGGVPIRPSLFHKQIVTLKYDPAGNLLWSRGYKGANSRSEDAVGLALDGSGNAYVAGTSEYYSDTYGIVTLKYNADGSRVWSAASSGLENRSARGGHLAVDAAGNAYVAGASDGGGTGTEIMTLAYDAAGGLLWSAGYNGPYNRADSAAAVAVDSSGNVFVTGRSDGEGSMDDFVTIKYRQTAAGGSGGDSDSGGGGDGCFITTARDSL